MLSARLLRAGEGTDTARTDESKRGRERKAVMSFIVVGSLGDG